MVFVLKSVNSSEHIGQDLIELRKRRGWDRKEASRQTRLTESFISALEEEQWEELGDLLYAERMVRMYVKFLGGNEQYFVQKYERCIGKERLKPRPQNERLIRPVRVQVKDLLVGSRLLAFGGFVLFVLLLGWYVFAQARQISSPPELEVMAPAEGIRVNEPHVLVEGQTVREATVLVNGRTATVESNGHFSLQLDIPRGTTLLVISARKRHGDEATVVRHVVYDRPLPPLLGPVSQPDAATTTEKTQP